MKINADFTQRILLHSHELPWQDSPMAGVKRRPLDRVGVEVARATSIVEYAPGSHFSPHVHTGGEEFLVLDGVFQDEHGNFPAGSYIRNPPQSRHTPRSDEGCVIFVKLWQFEPQDRTHVRLNTGFMQAIPHRDYAGILLTPLYQSETELVSLLAFAANAKLTLEVPNGAELLVISGGLQEQGDELNVGTWLRLPPGATLQAIASEEGAQAWVKQHHLGNVKEQIARLPLASS